VIPSVCAMTARELTLALACTAVVAIVWVTVGLPGTGGMALFILAAILLFGAAAKRLGL
jgi:hypothetical protein